MAKEFEFVRLVGAERRVGPTLASVSRHWKQEEESFLFISPHDDDVVLGGGLMFVGAGLGYLGYFFVAWRWSKKEEMKKD